MKFRKHLAVIAGVAAIVAGTGVVTASAASAATEYELCNGAGGCLSVTAQNNIVDVIDQSNSEVATYQKKGQGNGYFEYEQGTTKNCLEFNSGYVILATCNPDVLAQNWEAIDGYIISEYDINGNTGYCMQKVPSGDAYVDEVNPCSYTDTPPPAEMDWETEAA